eukprot:531406_1
MVAFLVIIIFLIRDFHSKPLNSLQWSLNLTPALPRADAGILIAHSNNTIHGIGGRNNNRQEFEYHINTNEFQRIGTVKFPFRVEGSGSYYTQNNDIIYWINSVSGNEIIAYNLYTTTSTTLSMQLSVGTSACLTSHNNLLYIIGGMSDQDSTLNTALIYDISTAEWLKLPVMQTNRRNHACVVDGIHGHLYAIGGLDENDIILDSVEEIDLYSSNVNINKLSWEYKVDLPSKLEQMSAVTKYGIIVIIGGKTSNSPEIYSHHVYVLDCSNNDISEIKSLPNSLCQTSVIWLDRIYVFGGYNTYYSGCVDFWQESTLIEPPTGQPTDSPIINTGIDDDEYENEYGSYDETDYTQMIVIILVFSLVFIITGGCMLKHAVVKRPGRWNGTYTRELRDMSATALVAK